MFVAKKLEELIEGESGWEVFQDWMNNSQNSVEILPATQEAKESTLIDMQVSTRSLFGSIIYKTGGILIDSGWIRILGSGCERLPRSVADWNRDCLKIGMFEMPYHLMADDITGGFFAYDAGGLGNRGSMFYFSPTILQWEDLELTYPEFVHWLMNGMNIDDFYEGMRWDDWQQDLAKLPGDRAMLYLPFLFSVSAQQANGKDIFERKSVPVKELFEMYVEDLAPQAEKIPSGQMFEIRIEE